MKLTVDAEKAHSAVRDASKGAGGGRTLPTLRNVLIQAAGDVLAATGTDTNHTVAAKTDAVVEEGGAVLVDKDQITDLLKRLEGEVEFSTDGSQLHLYADSGEYHLRLANPDRFPSVPKFEGGNFHLPASDFERAKKHVAYAAKDTEGTALQGVLLESEGVEAYFVASDDHRIARLKTTKVDDHIPELLFSQYGIELAGKVFSGEEDVLVDVDENHIVMKSRAGDRMVAVTQLNYSFPNYRAVVPEHDNYFTVETSDLIDALMRLRMFTGMDTRVEIEVDVGTLRLTAESSDSGSSEEEVRHKGGSLEPVTLAVNANYALDVLRSFDSEVEIHYDPGDAESPITVSPVDDSGRLFALIVPLREVNQPF